MIVLKTLTMKNFMSVGNATQAVRLDQPGLTLVLGNNLDLGGEGSRNGTGKTTILNALSFCLFGDAITQIKRDNLINKTNQKNMSVSCTFEVDGKKYKVERGRKPAYFRFICDDEVVNEKDTDEAQGENRLTQDEVNRILGMSQPLFKQIIALNTYNMPFLAMKATEQRAVIEELLGITRLSDKADRLKEQVRLTKEDIKSEELRIQAVKASNERIEETIRKFKIKSTAWNEQHINNIARLKKAISELDSIDMNKEIENHNALATWKEQEQERTTLNKQLDYDVREAQGIQDSIDTLTEEMTQLGGETCPLCKQGLQKVDGQEIEKIVAHKKSSIQQYTEKHIHIQQNITHTKNRIQQLGDLGVAPSTSYNNINDAYEHKQNLENLQRDLEAEHNAENPHIEQIETLTDKNIEEIEYSYMNSLTKLKEHQEFLYRLLTSKDSFIRKKIIDQNLMYLNQRLNHYLELLSLPHEVIFQSDLSVSITELGRELDFDNLSRGERNRLILGLSWAFRDIFESTSTPINLLFIDELIDSGMDMQGVEASMSILKKMTRERHKNIFLISHKDELTGRVNSILSVTKENGFTSLSEDVEVVSIH
jgi:DNA repair exonuclease SbcCD ATPase subunit